ncbi:hypothetical protein Q644_03630 [Brucella intermedia 229E]|uniref:Uncharacterized protein n=1 Tax=Brucella intermedia 229E TaxID=1337887 RepID=U4V4W8_9HYPH|nr:hypothetical protein Q644_03630 [Brucella intermedia 229E]
MTTVAPFTPMLLAALSAGPDLPDRAKDVRASEAAVSVPVRRGG